jgi:putative phosphoesterase
MKRIGLLSDTHSHLDDGILKHLESVDEIWHAGDVGNMEVIERLAELKPLRGVYGNIDGQDIRKVFPEHLRFYCERVDVYMTHIGGYPGRYHPAIKETLFRRPPKLFICGHSHILKVMYDQKLQCLHLNPGAAGKSGWHKVRTLLRFSIDENEIKDLEVVEMALR